MTRSALMSCKKTKSSHDSMNGFVDDLYRAAELVGEKSKCN